MGLVRLPCFFNRVQRIEKYSTTSSKMIKKWNWSSFFSFSHNSKSKFTHQGHQHHQSNDFLALRRTPAGPQQ